MKNIIAALAVAALCAGIVSCDKAQGGPSPVRSTTTAPASKWVGRWMNPKGNVSYIVEAEKNGLLTGFAINQGGGKDRIVMKLNGANQAIWVTPIGVQVVFIYKSPNQVVVNTAGINAATLRIVR